MKKIIALGITTSILLLGLSISLFTYLIWTADTDSDGILDRWEKEYGLDPRNPADAKFDPDWDGLTNLDEFELGSSPIEKDLFIEVDYLEGYDYPLVKNALDNLTIYYQSRGVQVHVEQNSTQNIVSWDSGGEVSEEELKEIETEYHDFPTTHVYLLIAGMSKIHPSPRGSASPDYGAAIYMRTLWANPIWIQSVIMHEIGHCIGIGLQDEDGFGEVYCNDSDCCMGSTYSTEYCDDCWNSAFAPEGTYGDTEYFDTRLWNKYSVDEQAIHHDSGN